MAEPRSTDESTGLPFANTWRKVYLLVGAAFVLWVACLILLERIYS